MSTDESARSSGGPATVESFIRALESEIDTWVGASGVMSGPGADIAVPGVEFVGGIEAIWVKLEELALSCRREVWSFQPPRESPKEVVEAARRAHDDSFERGIRMRALTGLAARRSSRVREQLAALALRGAEYRCIPDVPEQMFVVDQQVVGVMAKKDGRADMFVFTLPGVVDLLVELFRVLWHASEPLVSEDAPTDQAVSSLETRALRAWARGATDVAVANELGISERSVRRLGESLCRRVAASSRFELGAKATLAGWVGA